MTRTKWRLFSVGGVDVSIDPSWGVIAVLVTMTFYGRFVAVHEDLGNATALGLAVATAILFFASLIGHEYAHAAVALRRGVPVRGITLFLFGGVTEAAPEKASASGELAIAAAGPLTSFGLAGLFGAVRLAVVGWSGDPIADALGQLAWINLALGAFNLLPGFPLDGGRLLRAGVWKATGDLDRATATAAGGGRLIGWLIMGFGVLVLVAGGLIGGLWFIAIGWFLAGAAEQALVQEQLDRVLDPLVAGDVMSSPVRTVGEWMTVAEAVEDVFLRVDHSAFPVVDERGDVVGLVALTDVRRVPREERTARTVAQVMRPRHDVPVVATDTPMHDVLERMTASDAGRALVAANETIVGIITPRDLAWRIRRLDELGKRAA